MLGVILLLYIILYIIIYYIIHILLLYIIIYYYTYTIILILLYIYIISYTILFSSSSPILPLSLHLFPLPFPFPIIFSSIPFPVSSSPLLFHISLPHPPNHTFILYLSVLGYVYLYSSSVHSFIIILFPNPSLPNIKPQPSQYSFYTCRYLHILIYILPAFHLLSFLSS